MNNFSKRIKELRINKNLTQRELASILSTTDKKISFWETAYTEPCLEELTEIALFFHVSADYLLGLENEDGTKTYAQDYDYVPPVPTREVTIYARSPKNDVPPKKIAITKEQEEEALAILDALKKNSHE